MDLTKVKRIERAASNKKLLEDLEVPKENLPTYLESIHSITDVAKLEMMVSTQPALPSCVLGQELTSVLTLSSLSSPPI